MLNEGESVMFNLKRTSPLLRKIISCFFNREEKKRIIASLRNISNYEVEVWIKRSRFGISIMVHASSSTFTKSVKIAED